MRRSVLWLWATVAFASPALGQVEVRSASPQALAWDGKALWTVDQDAKVRMLDAQSGAELRALESAVKTPRAMVFEGERIWIADDKAMILSALDRATGRVVKTVPLPTSPERGFKSVEGLAWDGKHLWAAYYAGFSSSLNEIDPETGRLLRSIYADCHPRGLASDGAKLWTLCNGGGTVPAIIDQRPILEREHEMLKARTFLARVEAQDPSSLTFDGKNLVVLDRRSRKLVRVPLPTDR
jgi:outer membrane protein assembly factor BamB